MNAISSFLPFRRPRGGLSGSAEVSVEQASCSPVESAPVDPAIQLRPRSIASRDDDSGNATTADELDNTVRRRPELRRRACARGLKRFCVKTAADAARSGTEFFKRGRFEDAARTFGDALQLAEKAGAAAGERTTILSNRSAALLRAGRLEEAESDASASLRLRPSAKAHFRRAKALFALRRFAEAAEECAAAAEGAGADEPSKKLYERGREEALRAGRSAAAARELREAGNALFAADALAAAEKYREALLVDPGDVAARANLAAALLALERHADAAELALLGPCAPSLVATEQRPVAAKLFLRAARALEALSLHADAVASLRLALDFAPGYAEAREELQRAREREDRRQQDGPLDPNTARVPRLATGGALLAKHVHFGNHYLQYPIGNTEASPAAPRAELQAAGERASLLFLGLGDVRNVLRTVEEAGKAGAPPATALDFNLCDIDRCVVARAAILMLAASRMVKPTPEDASFLWRAWFCLDMPPAERERLDGLLRELAAASSSPEAWAASAYGAWLRVPCPGDLTLLREVWEYWLSSEVPTLAKARLQRHSHDLRVTKILMSAQRMRSSKISDTRDPEEEIELRTNDAQLGSRSGEAQRFADTCGASFGDAPREMVDWFRCFSAAPEEPDACGPRALNPTLVTPPRGLCLVHYGLHPFRVFGLPELAACSDASASPAALALVPAPAPGAADGLAEPPPRALCRAAARRLIGLAALFAAAVSAGRVSASLYPADGLQLCWEGASAGGAGALPAAARFDFIDCSNLADNEGLWPLLTACGWRLREAPHAALTTTSMKWVAEHAEPLEYIRNELGFGPEMAPTLLGLRLATELDALQLLVRPPRTLQAQPSNTALEVGLRWKRAGAAQPTQLAFREGGPLHAALVAWADRSVTHPFLSKMLSAEAKRAKGSSEVLSHSALYLMAVAARDLAARAADGAAVLRAADKLVSERAEGGMGPVRSSLSTQWRVARALAGIEPAPELLYLRAENWPPLPPTPAFTPPCPMVRLLVARGAASLTPAAAFMAMASGQAPPGLSTDAFELVDVDANFGAVGFHVPADFDAAARRQDTEVSIASIESGMLLSPLALSYSRLLRLPARPPPAARPSLGASPLPEGVVEVEESGTEYAVKLSRPATARLDSPHVVVFSASGDFFRVCLDISQALTCASGGGEVRVVFSHPVALAGGGQLQSAARTRCDACGATSAAGLSCCSRCKGAWYCSQQCQRDDWKRGHRDRCRQAPAGPSVGGAAAAAPRFTCKKVSAADPVRLDLSSLPEWGEVVGEGPSELASHMAAMLPMEGELRRVMKFSSGDFDASAGDPLADLKESIRILFVKFAKDGVKYQALRRPDGRSDLAIFVKALLRAPGGAPLLHVGFADASDQHLSPDQIRALARAAFADPKTGEPVGVQLISVTEEELALFRRTLAGNARLLDPVRSAVSAAGVPLRPSFLMPLYHRTSLRGAEAEASELLRGLQQQRDPALAGFMARLGFPPPDIDAPAPAAARSQRR